MSNFNVTQIIDELKQVLKRNEDNNKSSFSQKPSSSSISKNGASPALNIFWFRRDLRLDDNAGFYHALKSGFKVLPIFIFDTEILNQLDGNHDDNNEDKDNYNLDIYSKLKKDKRVQFIYETVTQLKSDLIDLGSDLVVFKGTPDEVFETLLAEISIEKVFTNHDYEPQAIDRDKRISSLLSSQEKEFLTYKDQVIFEKSEIVSEQGKPYSVYTPYKNKWLSSLSDFYLLSYPCKNYYNNLVRYSQKTSQISYKELGFEYEEVLFPLASMDAKILTKYAENRDYPYLSQGTSLLGLHLRFGTLSIRELAREGKKFSQVWLSELIWREFFMQVLWHHPYVVKQSFKPKYDNIKWRVDLEDLKKWQQGKTGYPLVDAGMRELNQTGHMHNRVRMVVASFLTKHLLIHWREGERYFAKKLLDFDLAANNGNWQWAAGSGCDAAPYFRVFNPQSQQEKFDPQFEYIKKWVPEFGTSKYIKPMVEHGFARERCLSEFKKALS